MCLFPQFFVLDVYNSDGTPLTVDQIYMQLEKIWNSSLQTNKEPIGILTSQHRNTWGKAYNNLIKGEEEGHKYVLLYFLIQSKRLFYPSLDKTNKESVRAIQKSIFSVCLDAPMPRVSDELYQSRVAAQMLHGGGARWNSGNRWFDKTLQVGLRLMTLHVRRCTGLLTLVWNLNASVNRPQFIVGEDGTCGLVYEHAPAEGPPIVFLIDYVVKYM